MDIFVIKTSDANNISRELLEQFRHKKISNEKRLKEHCLSYLMLDRILKEVYKIENREIEFIEQKPYLKNGQKFFSISHSGDYIALGFSDHECGIDIEKFKQRDYVPIAERMGFSCKNINEFYFEWTKYEAEYKLGRKCKSLAQSELNDYIITAVCSDIKETFTFYIQNGETFSNL